MTTPGSEHIVSFAAPPVAEVVTSVRFAPMSDPAFLGLGQLWRDQWRSQYPRFDLQGPYTAPVESFDGGSFGPTVDFGFHTTPPLPRVWLTSDDGTELLQVQRDWFAANWRRGAPEGAVYDRWNARESSFVRNWGVLQAWLSDQGESAAVNQCEVTYINHISPIDGLWATHADASRVFKGLALSAAEGAKLEQLNWRSEYLLERVGDLPEARLHASVAPAYAAGHEPKPLLVFELTVRGAPGADFLAFYARARHVIVKSFVQMTSDEAREAWGQE